MIRTLSRPSRRRFRRIGILLACLTLLSTTTVSAAWPLPPTLWEYYGPQYWPFGGQPECMRTYDGTYGNVFFGQAINRYWSEPGGCIGALLPRPANFLVERAYSYRGSSNTGYIEVKNSTTTYYVQAQVIYHATDTQWCSWPMTWKWLEGMVGQGSYLSDISGTANCRSS